MRCDDDPSTFRLQVRHRIFFLFERSGKAQTFLFWGGSGENGVERSKCWECEDGGGGEEQRFAIARGFERRAHRDFVLP